MPNIFSVPPLVGTRALWDTQRCVRLEGTLLTVRKHLRKRCKDADPQRSMEKVFLSERAPLCAAVAPGGEAVQAGAWWGMPKEHGPRAASWREDGVPRRRPRTEEEEVTAHALHDDGPRSSWTFPLGISFPTCHPGLGRSRGSHEVASTPRHSAQSRAPHANLSLRTRCCSSTGASRTCGQPTEVAPEMTMPLGWSCCLPPPTQHQKGVERRRFAFFLQPSLEESPDAAGIPCDCSG